MRPGDLPSREALGRGRPHGHFMRYLVGCRCGRCRQANVAYKRKLARNRLLYGPNDLVPTDRVRRFLLEMQKSGIGYKTIAKTVGVGKTGLGVLIWPGGETKHFIRRRTEAKVLSYVPSLENLPKSNCVPAAETIARIHQLEAWGYPRALITRAALENTAGGLQIRAANGKGKFVVMARTAIHIRDFFAGIEAMRIIWEKHRGAIPRGYYVYWKEGTIGHTVLQMELRHFARGYDYHYRYPPELKEAIRLANLFKRSYRGRKHNAKEHTDRPTEPSIRSAGGACRQIA